MTQGVSRHEMVLIGEMRIETNITFETKSLTFTDVCDRGAISAK